VRAGNYVVNKSNNLTGLALRYPGVSSPQISRKLAHEYVNVVIPTHRPPLIQANTPGTHFC
jgi:hypothetical protein